VAGDERRFRQHNDDDDDDDDDKVVANYELSSIQVLSLDRAQVTKLTQSKRLLADGKEAA